MIKENPLEGIKLCPLCGEFGKFKGIKNGYAHFIHQESQILSNPIPIKDCHIPEFTYYKLKSK